MDEHGLHADVIHEDDVGEEIGEGLFVIHDRPADLDDDDFFVEALDIPQGFDQGGSFINGKFINKAFSHR